MLCCQQQVLYSLPFTLKSIICLCVVLYYIYGLTSISRTSNDRLPLSTGKEIVPAQNIDHGKWTSEEQHLSRATTILCRCLMLLYRGYTILHNHVFHTLPPCFRCSWRSWPWTAPSTVSCCPWWSVWWPFFSSHDISFYCSSSSYRSQVRTMYQYCVWLKFILTLITAYYSSESTP